jgi:hypothetical protein
VNGPSAVFPDSKTSQLTRTNADGQAAATGWKANGQAGTFQVRVTATRANEMGEAVITMANVARITEATKKQKRWWNSTWFKVALIAGIAGAVTAGVMIARDDNGGPASAPPVVISPGSPSIGGPQ